MEVEHLIAEVDENVVTGKTRNRLNPNGFVSGLPPPLQAGIGKNVARAAGKKDAVRP